MNILTLGRGHGYCSTCLNKKSACVCFERHNKNITKNRDMENREIPTAEEFLRKEFKLTGDRGTLRIDQLILIIEQYSNLKTKHHVQRALEAAAENAVYKVELDEKCNIRSSGVDKQSILNAYSLDQIK